MIFRPAFADCLTPVESDLELDLFYFR